MLQVIITATTVSLVLAILAAPPALAQEAA
jgi:hypothetical protein